jgi:hypothetical protein
MHAKCNILNDDDDDEEEERQGCGARNQSDPSPLQHKTSENPSHDLPYEGA